jgi:predicted dehydrogenase
VGRTRIGVVGAGLMGRKHVELLCQDPDCDIAGIADPTPRARGYAEAGGLPYFADHRDLLRRAKPDGVIVATPNTLHVPVAIDCVGAGVPVLVEKPIAESSQAAAALNEAARRAAVPVLVGHYRRYNPIVAAARDIVQSGALGQLTAVMVLWLLQKPADYFDTAWRREPGGGPILINLIHDIDNLRFVCGEISAVQAVTSSRVRGFPVEDTAAVILQFASGAVGTITLSDAVPAPWSWELASGENPAFPRQDENCYLLTGTRASLALPRLELWRYAGDQGWWAPLSRERLAVEPMDPLVLQLRHFRAVIRGEEAPRITAEDATRTLAAVEAVQAAAANGRAAVLA